MSRNPKVEKKPKLRLYDNSMISAFKRCPRYYYFRHIRHFAPVEEMIWHVFGRCWHLAMDVVWDMMSKDSKVPIDKVVNKAYNAWQAEWTRSGYRDIDSLSPELIDKYGARNPGQALEMLYGYVDTRRKLFANHTFKLHAIEQPFAVPMDDEDPSIIYVGRLDKVFEIEGRWKVGEHKTTTEYYTKGGFRNNFLESFSPNSQVDGYLFAGHLFYGPKLHGAFVDAALVHKSETAFTLISISKNTAMLDSWLWEARYWINQIEVNKAELQRPGIKDEPFMAAFPRNTNSCIFFGLCPYIETCRMWENPEARYDVVPPGSKIEKWEPFDFVRLDKIGIKKGDVE
jgi:hypothetical protein